MNLKQFFSGAAVATLALSGLSLASAPSAFAAACTASGTPLATGGTSGSPTLIGTVGELAQLSVDSNTTNLTGYYKLAADIDLGGCEWTPIGAWSNTLPARTYFGGTLDGDGHVISNLSITSGTDRIGLVGYTFGGTVKNLGVENVAISTSATTVGAVVGFARGTLQNVYSTGTVSGSRWVGGIAGDTQSLGSISNSYSTADVTATTEFAGGLVGITQGGPAPSVSNSFSTGQVSAPAGTSGGLIGRYLTGTITNSFYDQDTSGQSDTGKGEPKTTSELTSFSTFSAASWDITDGWEAFDTANSKIWGICSSVNSGYPFLLWEHSAAPSCTAPPVSASASASGSNQGIFLYIARTPGREVDGTPVYYGSVGIKPNTTYLLSVQSVTNPGLTRTVLATGTVNGGGNLDARLEMGTLKVGTYKIVMTGTHRLGYPLVLTNYISVDTSGTFVSISPENLQPTLS